jgi:hypothetical protein
VGFQGVKGEWVIYSPQEPDYDMSRQQARGVLECGLYA